MSIIFFEGFDLYGQETGNTQTGLMSRDVWTSGENRFQPLARLQPRNGGLDFSPTSSDAGPSPQHTNKNQPPTLRAVAGIAFKSENFGYYQSNLPGPVVLHLNGQSQFYATLYADGGAPGTYRMEVNCWGTDYYIDNLEHDIWHYIEMEQDNTGATTVGKVWLNGSLQVNHTHGSLVGNPYYTGMSGSYGDSDPSNPERIVYDDMYFLDCMDDSDGPTFQDRLGPIQIRPCPLTADGTPSQWGASSGGAKYLDVDEQPGPSDLDSTNICTVNADQTQMFRCSPADASLPIIAVTALASIKQPDPGIGVAEVAFMVDDQEGDTLASPLQGSYRLFSQNYVTLPGGSLTVPVIQATNWGVKSLAGAG